MEVSWEQHCADLAVAHVKETTGRDIWKEVGGAPRSAKEAADLYRKLKVRTLRTLVTKLLGKPIKPALAMREDIALVMSAPGKADAERHREHGQIAALGIVRGDLIECADRVLPIDRAVCCWKISPFRK